MSTNVWSEVIDAEIEAMLEDDSYYQGLATSLKPASVLKEEHRKKLREFFEMKELYSQLASAQKLALDLLPPLVAREQFTKIKDEIEQSTAHFVQFVESTNTEAIERPILFQEMFGFSDETLLHMYDLASDLVNKKKYEYASDLFRFLTVLAPHVASYWIGLGVCLQALDRHEDATAVFRAAKFLHPLDPLPLIHIMECYLSLKDKAKIKQELAEIEKLIEGCNSSEKAMWRQNIEKYRMFTSM